MKLFACALLSILAAQNVFASQITTGPNGAIVIGSGNVVINGKVYTNGVTKKEDLGPAITETRELGEFTGIAMDGAVNVDFTRSKEYSVKVDAPKALMGDIHTSTDKGVLSIHLGGSHYLQEMPAVHVTGPSLKTLGLIGVGSFAATGLDQKDINVVLQGTGSVRLKGKATSADYLLKGTGDIKAKSLKTEHVKVDLRGTGDLGVYASKSISGHLGGTGDIEVEGEPAIHDIKVTGTGDVDYE